MRFRTIAVLFMAVLLSACGTNTTQRVATSTATGAAIGGVVGGPLGLGVGFAVGAIAGALTPVGADEVAANAIHEVHEAVGEPETETAQHASSPAKATSAPPSSSPTRLSPAAGSTVATGRSPGPPAAPAQPRPIARPSEVPLAPDVVTHIQAVLKSEGYYDAAIDGIYGPRTRSGLAAYKVSHGLPNSSVLDLRTLQLIAGEEPTSSGSQRRGSPPSSPAPPPR